MVRARFGAWGSGRPKTTTNNTNPHQNTSKLCQPYGRAEGTFINVMGLLVGDVGANLRGVRPGSVRLSHQTDYRSSELLVGYNRPDLPLILSYTRPHVFNRR